MSRALYIYSAITLKELETILLAHQDEFEHYLDDLFSVEEREFFEKLIESIGAIYVQPVLSELTFEDLYPREEQELEQRDFFKSCQSSLCIENLPYLEENPFQVSYLRMLLSSLPEVLVDQGGVEVLLFKADYINVLSALKSIETITSSRKEEPKVSAVLNRAIDPIDFLINDVRLLINKHQSSELENILSDSPEQVKKIFQAFTGFPTNDSYEILRHSGLKPKEFDDYLERLKIILKKSP
jgi:hypothetical protein